MNRAYLYSAVFFTGLSAASFAKGVGWAALAFGIVAVLDLRKVYR